MIKLLNKQYDKTKIPKEALKVIESMKNPQYSENELKWDKMIDLWFDR